MTQFMRKYALRAFAALAIMLGVAVVSAPASAAGLEGKAFYAGCNLFGPDAGGQFATSFKAPFATNRTIRVYRDGQEVFGDTSPVPASIQEGRFLRVFQNGKWRVEVRLGDDNGPVIGWTTNQVNCPMAPTLSARRPELV